MTIIFLSAITKTFWNHFPRKIFIFNYHCGRYVSLTAVQSLVFIEFSGLCKRKENL
jgi:hypothetical protein